MYYRWKICLRNVKMSESSEWLSECCLTSREQYHRENTLHFNEMFYISVKLPQIIKIVNGKSGEGISMASVIFELVAISATLSYGYAKSFPFR